MQYLYLKKHKLANKFYLGKTCKDPFKYSGSGVYWLRILKKYGNDVETVILRECKDNAEVREWGMYYSELWDIVNNDLFCNMTEEYGTGGPIWKGRKHSVESIAKMRVIAKKRGNNGVTCNGHTEATKEKIRQTLKGRPRTEQAKAAMRKPKRKAHCIGCRRYLGIGSLNSNIHKCKGR